MPSTKQHKTGNVVIEYFRIARNLMGKETNPIMIRYNTDRFTEEIKKEIQQLFKGKDVAIAVKGKAKQDFLEWLKNTYTDLEVDEDGYYTKVG